ADVSREDLLIAAGLGAAYPADVFVGISQWALLPEQHAWLWTGTTVTIVPPECPTVVGDALEERLLSPDGWDATAPLPTIPGPAFCLLTDEGISRFPIDRTIAFEVCTIALWSPILGGVCWEVYRTDFLLIRDLLAGICISEAQRLILSFDPAGAEICLRKISWIYRFSLLPHLLWSASPFLHLSSAQSKFDLKFPVVPQPAAHFALVVALPAWDPLALVVVLDLSRWDGRVFAVQAPSYATRANLLWLAGLSPLCNAEIYAGVDQYPLGADAVASLFSGECVFFQTPGDPPSVYSLGELLLSDLTWVDDHALPSPSRGDCYCLVTPHGHYLHIPDSRRPWDYRREIAARVGEPESSIDMQPALPRVRDCMTEGYVCNTVIAVALRRTSVFNGAQKIAFLDCRFLLQAWALLVDDRGQISHAFLLQEYGEFCPMGYALCIDGDELSDGVISFTSGQVLTATYAPFGWADSPLALESSVEDSVSSDRPGSDASEFCCHPLEQPSSSVDFRPGGGSGSYPSAEVSVLMTVVAFLPVLVGCWNWIAILWDSCPVLAPLATGPVDMKRLLLSYVGGFLLFSASCQCADAVHFFRIDGSPEGRSLTEHPCELPDPAHLRIHSVPTPCRGRLSLPIPAIDGRFVGASFGGELTSAAATEDIRSYLSGTDTLLNECARSSQNWAFLAVTLLETLIDFFGARTRPCIVDDPIAPLPVRPRTLALDLLVPVQPAPLAPTQPTTVEVFDLDARQCQLPCSVSDVKELFSGASFVDLPDVPPGLARPERFARWRQDGYVGRSPAPDEILVLTSDGSYSDGLQAAGWGVTVSLVSVQSLRLPGQYIGSFGGGMNEFRAAVPAGTLLLDPYMAEVAGLLWAGIAVAKLPWHGAVLFRADNTSALAGVQGMANMPDHPVCLLARNLHTALQLGDRCSPSYQHVPGHAGDEANELADALAGLASISPGICPTFRFDLAFWCSGHGRRSLWLPHLCAALARPEEFPCLREDVHSWSRGGGVASHPPEFAMAPFLRDVTSRSETECTRVENFRLVTYNALSLLGGVPSEHPSSDGLHGSTGRVSLLARTLEVKEVAIAGLQECRTPQGTMSCGAYRRLASGCDANSCFGVELWLHRSSPIEASSAVVLHAEPTCLIVGASFQGAPIRILVGHAPHRVHPEPFRRAWWSHVSNLCRVFSGAVSWIMLLDANARLGSETSASVGDWQADEQDLNGELFRELLTYLACWLPATYHDSAFGDGGTLYQKRNCAIVRSDYVAVPLEWATGRCLAWVDPEVSAGHMCVDHFAALLSVRLSITGPRRGKKAVRISSAALQDPDNAAQISSIVQSAPRPAWSVDASEHAAIVVDYLYGALAEKFPSSQRKFRAAYFTAHTEELHRAVSALRHRVRAIKLALRFTSLRCAFQAWASSTTAFGDLHQGLWLWRLKSNFGLYCLLLRRFGLQLRRQCRSDRAAHFEALATELSQVVFQSAEPAGLKGGLSCAVMFLDLASAYYGVIRETVMGSGLSDKPIEAIAESLALTADDLQMLRHYASEEPALQVQDASELLLELGREMHASTWFVLSQDDQVVHTSRGTRPGGALADIVFNVLFSKVLQRRDPVAFRDTVPVVPWDGRRSPYHCSEGGNGGAPQALGDVVYADDLATFVVSPTALELRPALGRVASATLDVLGPHGLQPNYGPKKTAAIIAVHGKGSRGVRRSLFGDLHAKLPVFLEHAGAVRIDLVTHYKHLGSHLSYDGTMTTELKYRLALGRAAFKEGRQRLFACRRIQVERRAFLFRTYVLSAVMAGAGTWPWLSATEWQIFSGGIINLYRQLLCLKAEGGYEVTTSQILYRCGLPSPASLLALARLRFLSQLVRHGPDPAWAVLSGYTPFQKAIDSSCRWLLQAVQGSSDLLDPAQHWHTWHDVIVSQPGRWKGLLKRAEAWHQEVVAMQALMDSSARSLWTQRPLQADDEAIFETVKRHIEPLPVLRRTLEQWVNTLPDSNLRSSGRDVLLVLHPEHQCSRVSGKAAGSSEPPRLFDPVVHPSSVSLPLLDAPVAWIGGLCPRWVELWGLGLPLPWPLCPSRSLTGAAAICCYVPTPPFPCASVDAPPPCRLHSLRANRAWLGQVLSAIELLLLRVRAGIPVLLRLPVPFSALRPFSEWLVQQAVALDPTPNCFTLEFI
ncbi:unnamed protein product, partial [Symbiodinium microadriaticum]